MQHLQASDISAKAVADTEENFAWLMQHLPETSTVEFSAQVLDAAQLEKIYGSSTFDVVITEPYLGHRNEVRRRGRVLLPLVSALSRQYTTWLQSIAKVLKPNGRTVMVWPFYRVEPQGYFLQLQKAAHEAGFYGRCSAEATSRCILVSFDAAGECALQPARPDCRTGNYHSA